MAEALRPNRGGFLRVIGCGQFVREFLAGRGPLGSPSLDPEIGAPQSDIFRSYKLALMRATAVDRSTRAEEKTARRENRRIDPDNIDRLTQKYLDHLSYKGQGCRFHSFIIYFSTLQRLGWVEATGREEPSAFQEHHPPGPPRRYYRLTDAGRAADDTAWRNPHRALYG